MKRETIPIGFLFDEIDVDSNLKKKISDVFFVQNRVGRPSKSLFRETKQIKEFYFEPSFGYPSFKITAELHLTTKKNF